MPRKGLASPSAPLLCSIQHYRSGNPARHICNANDRTAAPDAAQVEQESEQQSIIALCSYAVEKLKALTNLQVPSPDGSAVLENSEQFKVHLLAALEDARVKQ